ncbi:hypothetical protein [Neoaquamicrobium sediminum]|uniref:Transposase n=1 Tax=Neoaquamicrobium sediminum TaxID=1849104 RepID=A0ABV3X1N4_9HYPH
MSAPALHRRIGYQVRQVGLKLLGKEAKAKKAGQGMLVWQQLWPAFAARQPVVRHDRER